MYAFRDSLSILSDFNTELHFVLRREYTAKSILHSYQAEFCGESRKLINRIEATSSPMDAMMIGRYELKNFDEKAWNEHAYSALKEVVRKRVMEHEQIKNFLLETKDKKIFKDNRLDGNWGTGKEMIDANQDFPGRNLLGRIYMEIRNELQQDEKKK